MEKSESITALCASMVKAQSSMTGAKKSAENPFFKKKYADLASVMEATKTALADNGLAIMQFPIVEQTKVGVNTMVIHESGEWVSQVILLPCLKQDPQACGSAISYAKRYAWQAVCGIPSDDDDGNTATVGHKEQQEKTEPRADPLQEQAMNLFDKHKNNMTPEQRQWCMDGLSAQYRNYQGVMDFINQTYPPQPTA